MSYTFKEGIIKGSELLGKRRWEPQRGREMRKGGTICKEPVVLSDEVDLLGKDIIIADSKWRGRGE